MNLLGHEKSRSERASGAKTGAAVRQGAGPGFSQVSLETALLSALQVHVDHPDNTPLSGDQFRRLLGYEQTSGNSVRLLVGMQQYGLTERRGKSYLLSSAALNLLGTADEKAFQTGLRRAATLPDLMRELTAKYGTDLDARELRENLKSRQLPENERRTLVKVLLDNQELLVQTARSRALFEQFGKQSPSRRPASPVSAASWLRSLPGRTANLTLAAVVFVVLLVAFATLPGSQKPVAQTQTSRAATPAGRQVEAPVAMVSVPPVQASSPASSTPVPRRDQATVSGSDSGPADPTPAAGATATQAPAASQSRPLSTAQTRTAQTRPRSQVTQLPGQRATPSADASSSSVASSARVTPVSGTASASSPSSEAVSAITSGSTQLPRQEVRARSAQDAAALTQTSQRPTSREQASLSPAPAEPSSPLELGRRLATLLYSQRLTSLWETFSPGVQKEWGSFPAFREYRLGGLTAYGAETRVVSEEVRVSGGVTYYVRTATFERGPDHDWTLILGLNPAGRVVEFNIVAAGVLPGVAASTEN